jgi:uncharacterized protein
LSPEMPARIPIRLTPRTNRDAIEGWQEDVLRVRVTAPPVDGKANEALLRLLAEVLNLPRTCLSIAQGEHSRRKLIEASSMPQSEADRRLGRYAS